MGYNSNVVLFSNYIFYLHLKSAECSCQQWPKMKLYSWNCLAVIKMCRNFNRVADISSCSVRTWKFSNLILPWLNFSDCWVIPLHSYVFFINLSSKSLVRFCCLHAIKLGILEHSLYVLMETEVLSQSFWNACPTSSLWKNQDESKFKTKPFNYDIRNIK